MIKMISKGTDNDHRVILTRDKKGLEKYLEKEKARYAASSLEKDKNETLEFDALGRYTFVQLIKEERDEPKRLETSRKSGDKMGKTLNERKIGKVTLIDHDGLPEETLAFAEGMLLGNYQFLKYKTDRKDKEHKLKNVSIVSEGLKKREVDLMNIIIDAVYKARTLVNEPLSYLTAGRLSKEIEKMCSEAGAKVEILTKKKIQSLKMGGLLAVNKGSEDPPTFTIVEWKPEKPVNDKPVILVGKGVVFDTGGLNLKPGSYMDDMKQDMAGAAVMSAVIYATAAAKLPVHVITLVPATDNRPSGNACVPGDVIRMYDGTTVEIRNTDAEGRMILADALSYARKFDPVLVIDAATLTGAASRAIGKYGIVAMHDNAGKEMDNLKKAGNKVYERIAEFPFWEEYGELIKSEVADIKNIGGTDAGMITAGKFLAHFTGYPFLHLDIAGPSFLEKKDSYRTAGGTGMGTRLLFEFLRQW